jgi:hypothetical protein
MTLPVATSVAWIRAGAAAPPDCDVETVGEGSGVAAGVAVGATVADAAAVAVATATGVLVSPAGLVGVARSTRARVAAAVGVACNCVG